MEFLFALAVPPNVETNNGVAVASGRGLGSAVWSEAGFGSRREKLQFDDPSAKVAHAESMDDFEQLFQEVDR